MLKTMAFTEFCLRLVSLQSQRGFKTKVTGGYVLIGIYTDNQVCEVISLMQISRQVDQ